MYISRGDKTLLINVQKRLCLELYGTLVLLFGLVCINLANVAYIKSLISLPLCGYLPLFRYVYLAMAFGCFR